MATSAFGKAFREARASGDKTFTFNGKKYTTDLAPDEQKSVGGKPKLDKYVPRDDYVRSGRKSFDTETESVPPDMSKYKPRRDPEALTSTDKPGTRTRYENSDTSDMTYKRGGKVKKMASGGSASSRADGIASRGKTRGKMC